MFHTCYVRILAMIYQRNINRVAICPFTGSNQDAAEPLLRNGQFILI